MRNSGLMADFGLGRWMFLGLRDARTPGLYPRLWRKTTFSSPSAPLVMMEGDISHQERWGLVGEQLQRSPGGKNLHREDIKQFLWLCNEPKTQQFAQAVPDIPARNGAWSGSGDSGTTTTPPPRISSCFITWYQLTPIPGVEKSQGQPPLASGSSSHTPSHLGIGNVVMGSGPCCPSQAREGLGFPRLTFKTGIRGTQAGDGNCGEQVGKGGWGSGCRWNRKWGRGTIQ